MPHEKIWDRHNTSALPGEDQPPQNALEVHWSSGPDNGPDGYVQVTVDRPGVDARGAVDPTTAMSETLALLQGLTLDMGVSGGSLSGLLGEAAVAQLAAELAPMLAYSFGPPVHRLGIQLDRDGVNRLIRSAKRGGRTAFGSDEW